MDMLYSNSLNDDRSAIAMRKQSPELTQTLSAFKLVRLPSRRTVMSLIVVAQRWLGEDGLRDCPGER